MPRPRVVIFDLGGVFFHYNDDFFTGGDSSGLSAEPEKVKSFFRGEHWYDYERGRISSAEFYARVQKELHYPHDYAQFVQDFLMRPNMRLNEEMFEFFLALKVKYGDTVMFWALSNINELHYNHLFDRWPGVIYNFLETFLSFRMDCRKPDPEIYDKMLKTGRMSPYVCLFIDDKKGYKK